MASASQKLVEKLREAAVNLESGADYNWGNATKCNCAHLVQCLAPDGSKDSLKAIRNTMLDEWSEYANDYCPQSGAPTDQLLGTLYDYGMTHEDIHQLEYLSNRDVLSALPGGFRYLQHGNRRDVALYMRTWAALLEQKLLLRRPSKLDLSTV
ncbi:MAG: hypothetical protein AAF065_02615 [Verrucomicrobiota bacterium]